MSNPAENVRQIEGPTSRLPVQSETSAVLHMIERVARDASVDMDKMTTLMKWHKDTIADQKRAAFDEAMAEAKAEIPTIRKNREVDSGGRGPKYRFEDLAEIARTVDPILTKHGLNYRFRTKQEGAQISVTCVVSHRGGHSEENTLQAGPDNGPGRNAIQQIGSTQTYLQRYTLKSALGLAASDDDDGRSTGVAENVGAITADQAAEIRRLLAAAGKDESRFLRWAKAETIEAIRADYYQSCVDTITAKAAK